jgi:hypothetical protein
MGCDGRTEYNTGLIAILSSPETSTRDALASGSAGHCHETGVVSLRMAPNHHGIETTRIAAATGMGMVGSAMVSSGNYVDLLDNLKSRDAQASDPRDCRRIQNLIVGEEETRDLHMILRIVRANDKGRIMIDRDHGLVNGSRVICQIGFGDLYLDSGDAIPDGETFSVRVFDNNPREIELHMCSSARFEKSLILKGVTNGNIVREDYILLHKKLLVDHEKRFLDLDKQVRSKALPGCHSSFPYRHSSGSLVSPTLRGVTLSQVRVFAKRVQKAFHDEGWNQQMFEERKSYHRQHFGSHRPGEHYSD